MVRIGRLFKVDRNSLMAAFCAVAAGFRLVSFGTDSYFYAFDFSFVVR
jgi:hypothetical protein